jgi:hypothetical protein
MANMIGKLIMLFAEQIEACCLQQSNRDFLWVADKWFDFPKPDETFLPGERFIL